MKKSLKEFKQLSLWSMMLFMIFVTNSCDENNNSTKESVNKTGTYTEKADLTELINKIGDRDLKLIELIKNNPVSMIKTASYQKTKTSSSEYYFDTDNIMALKNETNQAVYIIPAYKSSNTRDNNIYSISINITDDFIDTKLNIVQLREDGTQEYISRDFVYSSSTSKTSKVKDMECYCTIYIIGGVSNATGWYFPETPVMYCSECSGGGFDFGMGSAPNTGGSITLATVWASSGGGSNYGYVYITNAQKAHMELLKLFRPADNITQFYFTPFQQAAITGNLQISNDLIDFLNTDGKSQDNKNFVISILDGIEAGTVNSYEEFRVLLNVYKQAQVILALKTQLKSSPSLLLNIPCSEIPKWQALISLQIPTSVKNKITTLDNQSMFTVYNIQYLEHASGAAINLDYFPVTINTLPKNPTTGIQFTPTEFLNYVRLNINSFIDTTISSFSPTTLNTGYNEAQIWSSTNPLGAIIHIDIPLPAGDGSVVCSETNNNHWIFTTIKVPYGPFQSQDGIHPVSGNREFGLTQNPNGTYTFYTRGVDRMTDKIESIIGQNGNILLGSPFDKPDLLWNSLKTKIFNFVQNNNGSVQPLSSSPNVIWRPDWYKVRQVLRREIPISDLGCN